MSEDRELARYLGERVAEGIKQGLEAPLDDLPEGEWYEQAAILAARFHEARSHGLFPTMEDVHERMLCSVIEEVEKPQGKLAILFRWFFGRVE